MRPRPGRISRLSRSVVPPHTPASASSARALLEAGRRHGVVIDAFSPQPGRCFRMVQSRQLQADHCRGEPAWKGQWQDVKGRWWYVEACRGARAQN